jgi:hypothetical protein
MFIVAWLLFQRAFPAAFKGPWHFAVAQCVVVGALLMPFTELVYRCVELPLAELGRHIATRMKHTDLLTTNNPPSALTDDNPETYFAEADDQNISAGQVVHGANDAPHERAA